MNRPVTISEMGTAFETPSKQIERLVARHHIDPALRIGRVRLYGPDQVRAVYSLIGQGTV
jgi:hypothetical protein